MRLPQHDGIWVCSCQIEMPEWTTTPFSCRPIQCSVQHETMYGSPNRQAPWSCSSRSVVIPNDKYRDWAMHEPVARDSPWFPPWDRPSPNTIHARPVEPMQIACNREWPMPRQRNAHQTRPCKRDWPSSNGPKCHMFGSPMPCTIHERPEIPSWASRRDVAARNCFASKHDGPVWSKRVFVVIHPCRKIRPKLGAVHPAPKHLPWDILRNPPRHESTHHMLTIS
mmetsp:Transcript_32438/g.74531  ORF Transcript_32438/g.74531 Transcript_32438/m.74531 type:complete len:224 (+) Transcript_32438:288-959(+)